MMITFSQWLWHCGTARGSLRKKLLLNGAVAAALRLRYLALRYVALRNAGNQQSVNYNVLSVKLSAEN